MAKPGTRAGRECALDDGRLPLLHHQTPVGAGRLGAEAQIGERGQGHQSLAEQHDQIADDRTAEVGDEVAGADPGSAHALDAIGVDVGLATFGECHRAGVFGDGRGVGETEREHGGRHSGAEDGDDQNGEQQPRKGVHDVGEAGDHGVDPAATPCGECAEGDTEDGGDGQQEDRGDEAGAGTVQHPREEVLSGGVGAEQMFRAGADQGCGEVDGIGGVRSEQRSEERRQDDHDERPAA